MKQAVALVLVSTFLFVFGQSLFCPRPAASSDDALVFSSNMRRSEQQQYLLDQARRFYRQGRFGEAFAVAAYAQEKLDFVSPELAEVFSKARQQLEESALVAAEKLQQSVRGMVDLK
jgi:hypothetical protein